MALKLELRRKCLDNVEDNAGRWQIEGGRVMRSRRHVANYSSVKRISCGTTDQNTAMLWVTIFFRGDQPPENITLHGSHDFNSGGQVGSVSAASSAHAALIGQQFTRVGDTLTIG